MTGNLIKAGNAIELLAPATGRKFWQKKDYALIVLVLSIKQVGVKVNGIAVIVRGDITLRYVINHA